MNSTHESGTRLISNLSIVSNAYGPLVQKKKEWKKKSRGAKFGTVLHIQRLFYSHPKGGKTADQSSEFPISMQIKITQTGNIVTREKKT